MENNNLEQEIRELLNKEVDSKEPTAQWWNNATSKATSENRNKQKLGFWSRKPLPVFISIITVILLVSGAIYGKNLIGMGSTPSAPNYVLGESMGGLQGAEFILNTTLPDYPKFLDYYQIMQSDTTKESVEELGAKLGFSGEAGIIESQEIFVMSTGNMSLRVSFSGRMEYNSGLSLFGSASTFPPDNEIRTIAEGFFKKIGLWFSDIEFKEIKVGGTVNTKPSHLLVQYRQYIDDMPLVGNGASFSVRISDMGNILKATIIHPELKEYDKVECINSIEACDSLMKGNGILFAVPSNCKKIIINGIYIGYFIEAHIEKQEYSLPVYVFEGECLDSDGNYIQDFITYIDAVDRD